jgi:hypothetical protein
LHALRDEAEAVLLGGRFYEEEDDILILASTVVIDMACHGDRQRQ